MNAEALRRQAYKLLEQADMLSQVPDQDPYVDGTVLTFQTADLSYAAIRAAGRWYVSGQYGPNRITWPKLLNFIGTDAIPTLRRVAVTVLVSEDAKNGVDR